MEGWDDVLKWSAAYLAATDDAAETVRGPPPPPPYSLQ